VAQKLKLATNTSTLDDRTNAIVALFTRFKIMNITEKKIFFCNTAKYDSF